MVHTITKRFGSYPFAHRQPKHVGHCRLIHGHNWTFYVSVSCEANALDECGFVIDFGKFKDLKEQFNELFDHTLVLNVTDPMVNEVVDLLDYAKIITVPDCSCEGLCVLVAKEVAAFLRMHRPCAWVSEVRIEEDEKNFASVQFNRFHSHESR